MWLLTHIHTRQKQNKQTEKRDVDPKPKGYHLLAASQALSKKTHTHKL